MTITGNSIPLIITHNPTVRDKDLEGAIKCNLIGFSGLVQVASKTYSFAVGSRAARVIYITPYGNLQDWLVSIKRSLGGVQFASLSNEGAHITQYVLGLLPLNTAEYRQAQQETEQAFEQKRRFIIAIATDCSDLAIEIDQNKSGTCTII